MTHNVASTHFGSWFVLQFCPAWCYRLFVLLLSGTARPETVFFFKKKNDTPSEPRAASLTCTVLFVPAPFTFRRLRFVPLDLFAFFIARNFSVLSERAVFCLGHCSIPSVHILTIVVVLVVLQWHVRRGTNCRERSPNSIATPASLGRCSERSLDSHSPPLTKAGVAPSECP